MKSEKMKIEEILQKEGQYVSTTVGLSMFPMLRNRKDTVIISSYKGNLKKYDVPLYKRGSNYILHRVVKVLPDSYVICGDNCIKKEYDIHDEDILGVLEAFYRGNKLIHTKDIIYLVYSRIWCFLYPIRYLCYYFRKMLVYFFKKMGWKR